MWEVAQPFNKRLKLFIDGPPGCFKTRLALRLGDNGNRQEPALAVLDTEFGTDWYRGQFAFRHTQSADPDTVFEAVEKIVRNPGKVRWLSFDTFSVYYEALMNKYADLYLKREIKSAGHKGEYYVLQPRDYAPINREAAKMVRMLLLSDLNIIMVCQIKDEWGPDMKVVGSVHDGWKRLPYYFDTILEIEEKPKKSGKFKCIVNRKDRTNHLKVGTPIAWESDEAIYQYLKEKFGAMIESAQPAQPFTGQAEKAFDVKVQAVDGDREGVLSPADELKKIAEEGAQGGQPTQECKSQPVTTGDQAAATTTTPPETVKPAEANEAKQAPPVQEQSTDTPTNTARDAGPVTQAQLVEMASLKNRLRLSQEAWFKMMADFGAPNNDRGIPSATLVTYAVAEEILRELTHMAELGEQKAS